MKFITFILTFFLALNVYAVPYGQDYLGGAKFQKAILENHDYSQGAGMFANTFGDSLPLATALTDRHIPFLRIQLAWSDSHTFPESTFSSIGKEAKRFCPLSSKTKLYLSGACEHKLNLTLATKLAQIVTLACPSATYVNVPMAGGAVLTNHINETHGVGKPKSPKSSYSSDGSPSEDIDIQSLKDAFNNSVLFMFWTPRYNGRLEDNDPTPRSNRTGYADGKMIKSMLVLAKPKGATSLPKNWLYKSHSEHKPTPDPRAEKPVIIAPIQTSVIKVGSEPFKYYGKYTDGRHRYYASKWGYEIGTSPLPITVLNKQIGIVNPSFRDGQYR